MAETLYRKYRPQSFADLVGQRHIRVTLEQALQNSRVAQAYLFTGPRGVGKTTTARIIARAVNCLDRGQAAEPCNQCQNCRAILDGRTMDIMEIDAASQTGVDNVRENIIQNARAYPSLLKMKVFIIDEVHMLSLSAFNALLKIIEEPPAHAMFILATTDVHRVPETIISRTQRFDFQRVGMEDMVQRLQLLAKREGRRLGTGVADRIARYGAGSLRDAESLLGQVFAFAEKEVTTELLDVVLPRSDHGAVLSVLESVVPGRAGEAIQIFHRYVGDGGDITTFIQDFLAVTRTTMLLTVDRAAASEVAKQEDADSLSRLQKLSSTTQPERCMRILDAFATALRQLPTATIEELPVEVAIVSVCETSGPTSMPIASAPPATPTPRPTPAIDPPIPPKSSPPKKTPTHKSVTLETATVAWSQLQQDKELPPGLALSVRQAELIDVEGTTLVLCVPFSLHADRLNSAKNAELIRNLLTDSLGAVSLRITVDPSRATADIPLRVSEPEPAPVAAPLQTLKPQPAVAVASGDELWDTLVASLGDSSAAA